MPKRRLFWHLFPSYALMVLAAGLGVGWLALLLFENAQLDRLRADARARAEFLDAQLGPRVPPAGDDFARLCRNFDEATGVRVALLTSDGEVACDSRRRAEEIAGQRDRAEITAALAGEFHDAIRYNAGLDQRQLFTAAPVVRDGQTRGVLYLSMSLTTLDETLSKGRAATLIASLAMAGLSSASAWRVARGLARPVDQIREAANRLALGQWTARVTPPDQQELGELAEAFNRLAGRLQERIGLLIRNNNEQKAVLASMAEGVLAVDSRERVISLNSASSRLLGIDQAQAQGRPLQEVVRHADLSRFISRALSCAEAIEADILLHGDRERVMQARGSALRDLEGGIIGAVIVLNDITTFRRLENIRRDFVANVSHELKTPVTSIKGFVETLLDGAVNDPVDSLRFLQIIAKQADRLHAIIEDLLSLSKIEQSEDRDEIALEPGPLRPLLESALHTCGPAAQERNIEIQLACAEDLKADINGLLLEQAVLNLLDNAIKYSEPGSQALVTAREAEGEVIIVIEDHGSGIASEHLARIFERFYRVDRARSRKLGGTGLGLAIVKHIVQAHHGRVSVESTLGAGSTFTIHLPRK